MLVCGRRISSCRDGLTISLCMKIFCTDRPKAVGITSSTIGPGIVLQIDKPHSSELHPTFSTLPFDWGVDSRPRQTVDTIIYEMHVRGLYETQQLRSVHKAVFPMPGSPVISLGQPLCRSGVKVARTILV